MTGKSGFGKSCLCINVLQKLYDEDDDYEMYILKQPDEWDNEWNEEWKECIDKTPVVFIDDFGSELDPNECVQAWDLKLKRTLDIKLVIAVDIDVLLLLQNNLNSYADLSNSNILNISSGQWKLSMDEKKEIFNLYCTSQFYTGPSFSKADIDEIVQSNPINGFLKTCTDFFKGKKYLTIGSCFFKSSEMNIPTKVEKIMLDSPSLFALLVLFLCKHTVAIDVDFSQDYAHICMCLGIEASSNDNIQLMIKELDEMDFVAHRGSCYQLSCNIVEDAVLYLLSRNHQAVLFEICDMSFITKYVRHSSYIKREGEVCICLEPGLDSLLVNTILKNIDLASVKSGDRDHVCLSHPSLADNTFFDMILSKMQEIWPFELFSEFVIEMLYWACCYGKRQMVLKLEKLMNKLEIITSEIINKALKHVSYCDSSCEKILNILVNSQVGTFVEPETIFQLLQNAETIGFKSQALQILLSKKTNKDVADLCRFTSEAKRIKNDSLIRTVLRHCLSCDPDRKRTKSNSVRLYFCGSSFEKRFRQTFA